MKTLKSHSNATLNLTLFGLLAGLLSGCQTPDLKPFRDSTAKIHNSVVEGQDAYLSELDRLQPYVPDDSELAKQSKRFTTNWEARVAVIELMVKYAGSLAAVADAPNQAKAGLDGVAQSVKQLGDLSGPYGSAIEGAVNLLAEFKFLADKVAAAKQLKKAVLATDENMQKLAQLLSLDFAKMRRALEQNEKSIKNLMDGPISVQLDARQAVENQVIERTKALQKRLDDPQWPTAVATFNQEMAETKKYLAEADKWYVPHRTEVELAQKEMAERIRLFRNTETALSQWAKAHGALAQALKDDMAPDWTLLKQSADRIEKSINKITNEDGKP